MYNCFNRPFFCSCRHSIIADYSFDQINTSRRFIVCGRGTCINLESFLYHLLHLSEGSTASTVEAIEIGFWSYHCTTTTLPSILTVCSEKPLLNFLIIFSAVKCTAKGTLDFIIVPVPKIFIFNKYCNSRSCATIKEYLGTRFQSSCQPNNS